jgi:Holliday junction resolvasome RuvABC endonuclease subunit
MNILALDPANKTGFAHSNGKHGVWQLGKGDLGAQHDELAQQIIRAVDQWGVHLIATENAGFGSRNPSVQASHNERLGVIRYVASCLGCDIVTFQPTTIKLFATGSGNADKKQMIKACSRLLGVTAISDDDCDALWILELAKRPDCWPVAKPKAKKARKAKSTPTLFR